MKHKQQLTSVNMIMKEDIDLFYLILIQMFIMGNHKIKNDKHKKITFWSFVTHHFLPV